MLLEICLDLTEDELKAFEHVVPADEEWNVDLGDFVKVENPDYIEEFLWHEIPAAIVNERGSVRIISDEERHRLMVFGPDPDDELARGGLDM